MSAHPFCPSLSSFLLLSASAAAPTILAAGWVGIGAVIGVFTSLAVVYGVPRLLSLWAKQRSSPHSDFSAGEESTLQKPLMMSSVNSP